MTLPRLAQLGKAATLVASAMRPTPEICWPALSARCGVEVGEAREPHANRCIQGAGRVVYVDHLLRRGPIPAGIITATRGNHGQSIAFAARRRRLNATIVVPHGNSVEKNAAMRAFGAELIEHGRDFQDALEYAIQVAQERNLTMVPSFDEALVRGVAAVVGGIIGSISSLIDFLSGPPQIEIPRKDQHLANDLDPMMTGANPAFTKNLKPSAPTAPSPTRPLQKAPNPCDGRPLQPDAGSIPFVTAPALFHNYCGRGDYGGQPTNPTDACCQAHDCAYANAGLSGANVNISDPGSGAGPAQRAADAALCSCVRSVPADVNHAYERGVQGTIGHLFCYGQ